MEQGWIPITFALLLIEPFSIQVNGNYQTIFKLLFIYFCGMTLVKALRSQVKNTDTRRELNVHHAHGSISVLCYMHSASLRCAQKRRLASSDYVIFKFYHSGLPKRFCQHLVSFGLLLFPVFWKLIRYHWLSWKRSDQLLEHTLRAERNTRYASIARQVHRYHHLQTRLQKKKKSECCFLKFSQRLIWWTWQN